MATKFSVTLIVAFGSETFFLGIKGSLQHPCRGDSITEAIDGRVGSEVHRKLLIIPSLGLSDCKFLHTCQPGEAATSNCEGNQGRGSDKGKKNRKDKRRKDRKKSQSSSRGSKGSRNSKDSSLPVQHPGRCFHIPAGVVVPEQHVSSHDKSGAPSSFSP